MTDKIPPVTIEAIIGKKPFFADASRIAYGDIVIATDAIDAVSYGSNRRDHGIRRNSCRLAAGNEEILVSFEVAGQPAEWPSLWRDITGFLDIHVLPRIAHDLAGHVAAGEAIRINRFGVDLRGITGREGVWGMGPLVTLFWSGIRDVGRGFEKVDVNGFDSRGRTRRLIIGATSSAKDKNAVVLPLLIRLMRGRERG